MSDKHKKTSWIFYRRGKFKITGGSSAAKRMMFIDLVTSKLFWIAVFIASIYLEHKTGVLSALFDLIADVINRRKNIPG